MTCTQGGTSNVWLSRPFLIWSHIHSFNKERNCDGCHRLRQVPVTNSDRFPLGGNFRNPSKKVIVFVDGDSPRHNELRTNPDTLRVGSGSRLPTPKRTKTHRPITGGNMSPGKLLAIDL